MRKQITMFGNGKVGNKKSYPPFNVQFNMP